MNILPRGPKSSQVRSQPNRQQSHAIDSHAAFKNLSYSVYAKGSYANNTNVRSDSDVDVAVECHQVVYYEDKDPNQDHSGTPYVGEWTPQHFREEVEIAVRAKFASGVDTSGTTAIQVNSNTSRVDADVVPSFTLHEYFANGVVREGTRVFKKNGTHIDNYAKRQLTNGTAKNNRTNYRYKKTVRILKRLENAMVSAGKTDELPSYLMECLIYRCPDSNFMASTWTGTIRACLAHIFNYTLKAEPSNEVDRWLEVNEVKFLFHPSQKWTREQVHAFADAAWQHMGFE
jgi:hypothetical protein